MSQPVEQAYTILEVVTGWVIVSPNGEIAVAWSSSEAEAQRMCDRYNAALEAKPPITEVY